MNKFFFLLTIVLTTTCGQNIDWTEIQNGQIFREVSLPFLANIPSHRPINPRIVNGTEVHNLEDFPYQVGMVLTHISGKKTWCGGSIISNSWILTAAHCMWEMKDAVVYIGAINRRQPEPTAQLINVGKEDFIIHEKFDHIDYYNDLALIRLKTPLEFSKIVKPIELINLKDSNHIDDKTITISGWGITTDKDPEVYGLLKTAKVSVLPNNECQFLFYSFGSPLSSTNTATLICANNKVNTGVCEGDSGGAAVAFWNGKPTQIGINSFVIFDQYSRCERVHARMFTRVSAHLDWICQKTGVCPK